MEEAWVEDAGVIAAGEGEGERLEGPWAWTAQGEGKAAGAQQQVWRHRAAYTVYNKSFRDT